VAVGDADCWIAGGVESIVARPLGHAQGGEGWRAQRNVYRQHAGLAPRDPRMEELYGTHALGETAELVAEKHGVHARGHRTPSRWPDQQRLGGGAKAAGRFAAELWPRRDRAGRAARRVEVDEHPRPRRRPRSWRALKPVVPQGARHRQRLATSSGIKRLRGAACSGRGRV